MGIPGKSPQDIELKSTSDIADLSLYSVESANNGNSARGTEFELEGSAIFGNFILHRY